MINKIQDFLINKLPFIQILTATYVIGVAVYMIFNTTNTEEEAEFWKNYYWCVNKDAMLFCLLFNYKVNKSEIDWTFINFLTIQTGLIIIYFKTGLFYYLDWMKMNDVVVYSFFVSSFVALLLMWYRAIRRAEKWH